MTATAVCGGFRGRLHQNLPQKQQLNSYSDFKRKSPKR
ncbi:hypothetical protein CKA32_003794 [Geitlerinema sp. FC II]|nr:hypothetical protein CKA32_003794 [Geitlerinema sp. FC II]